MAKTLWQDDYWLLLMQAYLKKPAGVKPMYSRLMVDLALEIHIPPQKLYQQMFRLRQIDTPRMEQLWRKYAAHPKKLKREAELLRRMNGFGQPDNFYDGVEVVESWEKDFKPISPGNPITPMMLIPILDLYFRLTPITMVRETPEIIELAKLMEISADNVVEAMEVFKFIDPYLSRDDMMITPLLVPCQDIWDRYGNDNPDKLAATAAQLKEYFTSEDKKKTKETGEEE